MKIHLILKLCIDINKIQGDTVSFDYGVTENIYVSIYRSGFHYGANSECYMNSLNRSDKENRLIGNSTVDEIIDVLRELKDELK